MERRFFPLHSVQLMAVLLFFPRHALLGADVQKKRQVWLPAVRSNAVYLRHNAAKPAPIALVGDTGICKAVCKHSPACCQCGKNFFFQMLRACRRVKQHFRACGHCGVFRVKYQFPYPFRNGRAARFPRRKHIRAAFLQIRLYLLYLCGFAAAVAALDRYKIPRLIHINSCPHAIRAALLAAGLF